MLGLMLQRLRPPLTLGTGRGVLTTLPLPLGVGSGGKGKGGKTGSPWSKKQRHALTAAGWLDMAAAGAAVATLGLRHARDDRL